MQIPCPHCGPRDSGEFTYGGDATKVRPAPDAPQSEWCDYIYARKNPMGVHLEYWQHTAGCRAVVIVERDVVTHEVKGARLAGAWGEIAASKTVTEAPVLEPAE